MVKSTTRVDGWLALAVIVALVSTIQFAIGTTLAMAAYPGGDYRDLRVDAPSHGYDWNHNWLSDLGRSKTWTGKLNTVSARYFNGSIIGLGVGLLIFFGIFHRAVDEEKASAWFMQACGALASMGLIALGLTPVDLAYHAHLTALAAWVVPMPLMAIVVAYQCFRSAGFMGIAAGTIAAAMALVLTVAIVCYAAAGSPSGYVVMQKIVVAISIVWFLLLALRVSFATIEIVTLSRLQQINRQAESYSERLQKGHRVRKQLGKEED